MRSRAWLNSDGQVSPAMLAALQSRVWLHSDGRFSPGKELFRRIMARRRLVVGVLAAVVVLLGITVGWRTESADDRILPDWPRPIGHAWRTESAPDRFVPAGPSRGLDALASPVDVGWLPSGFHPPRAALLAPGTYGLQTERGDPYRVRTERDDPPATLTVTMRDTKPTPETDEGRKSSIRVHGKPATVISVHRRRPTTWKASARSDWRIGC
ncbi:hypothetical protein [Cryptosporangium japonicum]|uniref:Uncharacterized protein n=1 Tax=Cryptosporangium japonicum TaxID=80872 RepID=A0ABP3D5P0_9ACTN